MKLSDDNLKSKVPSKRWPLVTIVTPVYNQVEYLEQTMRSVLTQSYPLLEYIVIDDGSRDGSFHVAKRVEAEYPDRVRVFTQSNSGQASTLNKGWGMARGQILAYISSDDCLLPQAVSQMVLSLQANPKATVAYCDFWLIDSMGRRMKESITEEFNSQRLCVDLVCQPGPGAFFQRAVFDKAGGWDPTLKQVPDFEFWLRAEKFGHFIRVPLLLAEYRIHDTSTSFRQMNIDNADEIVRVIKRYWNNESMQEDSRKSLARAHVIAAKNHAQSGRLLLSLIKFLRGGIASPKILMDKTSWRTLASGFLRYAYFRR